MKKSLISGITGQDGSYLAEYLLSLGYEVHGLIRRSSDLGTRRLDHIYQDPHDADRRLFLHYGDLADGGSVERIVSEVQPDEIFHLGAMSHVSVSFSMPEYTADITAIGTLRVLEAVRKRSPHSRIYLACSSEMFGDSPPPQDEKTPFSPRSPYADAKVFSYFAGKNYRDRGLWVASGVLFNHESPRRPPTFVTRKIAQGVVAVMKKKQDFLYLGNLDAVRDWGFAPEYAMVMHKILQQEKPEDFVIGTGKAHSVREFLGACFNYLGLSEEEGMKYVKIDERYLRPSDVPSLKANAHKARSILGWNPQIKFNELVKIMMGFEMGSEKTVYSWMKAP